jgi:hypothetical protein
MSKVKSLHMKAKNKDEQVVIDKTSSICSDYVLAQGFEQSLYLTIQLKIDHMVTLIKSVIALAYTKNKKDFYKVKEILDRDFKEFMEAHTDIVEGKDDDAEDETNDSHHKTCTNGRKNTNHH